MKKKCTVCGMVFGEEYEGEGCPRCGYEGWFEIEDNRSSRGEESI